MFSETLYSSVRDIVVEQKRSKREIRMRLMKNGVWQKLSECNKSKKKFLFFKCCQKVQQNYHLMDLKLKL